MIKFKDDHAASADFLPPQAPDYRKGTTGHLAVFGANHPPFDLLYHPMRWGWISGQWLPQLRRLPHSVGVQNVDKDGSLITAHAAEAAAGWRVVPHDPVDYVVGYDAKQGKAHFTRWEKVKMLAGQLITQCDEDGYAEWLVEMCERQGWAPDPDVLRLKIQNLESEIMLDEADTTNLKATHRAAKSKKMLAEMKRIFEPGYGESQTTADPPTKKRGA